MFFYNYNQRNFAMGTIVPDLSNPSEILRLIRELPASLRDAKWRISGSILRFPTIVSNSSFPGPDASV